MGYHSTYLLKRILASVATTFIYFSVDNAMYNKRRTRGHNYNNFNNGRNNYKKAYQHTRRESSSMRDKF